MSIMSFIRMR